MSHRGSESQRLLQDTEAHGWEGWLTPALESPQAERGQATLPDHEPFILESYDKTGMIQKHPAS